MATLRFPSSFVIGSATASYQIEGGVHEGGRGPSIWDTFSHTSGRIENGDTGDIADDHFHRWQDDLDLMSELGLQAYRFSIAWPRIQPTGAGAPNQAGLDFYRRLVDGLTERGIEPIATLYHWDLPQALEDAGGWPERDTAYRFAEYAAHVVEALGDRVHTWTTFNEPWCAAFLGYGNGMHAPGRTDGAAALAAAHHMNLAHGLAVPEIRRIADPSAQVSITLNLHPTRELDSVPADESAEARRRVAAVGDRIFLSPLLRGHYDADLLDDTSGVTDWSFLHPGDERLIHQPIDFLGVNYYSTSAVRFDAAASGPERVGAWPGEPALEFVRLAGPSTDMGWNIDPDALEELLVSLHEEYPDVPLMITENGAAFPDVVEHRDGVPRVLDTDRVEYLRAHFAAAHRAIERGVDLRGYLVWSFLDNFEWSFGFSKRFGIVRVDYDSQERIIKDSGRFVQRLIETRTLEVD